MRMLAIALLEVMDKELTVPRLWAIGAVGGLVGYVAGRWRPWAAIPVAMLLAFFAASAITELRDQFVGPAVIVEAGRAYPFQLGAAFSVGFILTAAGVWVHRSRARVERS